MHDVDAAVHEQLHVARVHDLAHDRHARLGARLEQEVEPVLAHALMVVGGGAGLVRAASQECGARRLAARGNGEQVVALHRAGARDDLEVSAADLNAAAEVDDRVLGVRGAVDLSLRLCRMCVRDRDHGAPFVYVASCIRHSRTDRPQRVYPTVPTGFAARVY